MACIHPLIRSPVFFLQSPRRSQPRTRSAGQKSSFQNPPWSDLPRKKYLGKITIPSSSHSRQRRGIISIPPIDCRADRPPGHASVWPRHESHPGPLIRNGKSLSTVASRSPSLTDLYVVGIVMRCGAVRCGIPPAAMPSHRASRPITPSHHVKRRLPFAPCSVHTPLESKSSPSTGIPVGWRLGRTRDPENAPGGCGPFCPRCLHF